MLDLRPQFACALAILGAAALGFSTSIASAGDSTPDSATASRSASTPPPSLQISADPSLYPAYDRWVTDYVTRCQVASPLQFTVTAPAGTRVAVDGARARGGTFTTPLSLSEGQAFSFSVARGDEERQTYHVRCLPGEFPAWSSQRNGLTQAQWYVVAPFLDTTFQAPAPGTSQNFVAFFDDNGVPVWWFKSGAIPLEAELLPNGNVAWTHFNNTAPEERRLDGSLVRTIAAVGSPLGTDQHDIQLLPNGDYLVDAAKDRSGVDLSSIGGQPDSTIRDAEIQEIAPDGHLVWSWDTFDHIPVSEQPARWRGWGADIYHFNSVEVSGNSMIISYRHLDAVYKIDRVTGNIVWKLGGTPRAESLNVLGDPVFNAGGGFGGQHDARILPDGTLTVHDNGTDIPRAPRAVRYKIDEHKKTATMLQQVTDSQAPGSACCGSARRLWGGDWVMSWGDNPLVTELSPFNKRVFSLSFSSQGDGVPMFTHRADPLPWGTVSAAALRHAMDVQYPR